MSQVCTIENGQEICINTNVSCVPPLLWQTDRCVCPDGGTLIGIVDGRGLCVPPPPPACSVTITYSPIAPSQPTWAASPHCDAAGLELAIAVVMARLLGMP